METLNSLQETYEHVVKSEKSIAYIISQMTTINPEHLDNEEREVMIAIVNELHSLSNRAHVIYSSLLLQIIRTAGCAQRHPTLDALAEVMIKVSESNIDKHMDRA